MNLNLKHQCSLGKLIASISLLASVVLSANKEIGGNAKHHVDVRRLTPVEHTSVPFVHDFTRNEMEKLISIGQDASNLVVKVDQTNQYEIGKYLANGAFGVVFQVQDAEGAPFVMKMMDGSFESTSNIALIQSEITILKQLCDAPKEVSDHCTRIVQHTPFSRMQPSNLLAIVLELCKDGDLRMWMDKRSELVPDGIGAMKTTVRFLSQVSKVLRHLNERLDRAHMDGKAQNIMIETDAETSEILNFFVGDFGMCGDPPASGWTESIALLDKKVYSLTAMELYLMFPCDPNSVYLKNEEGTKFDGKVEGVGVNLLCVLLNEIRHSGDDFRRDLYESDSLFKATEMRMEDSEVSDFKQSAEGLMFELFADVVLRKEREWSPHMDKIEALQTGLLN